MRHILLFLVFSFFVSLSKAQNTIGVLSFDAGLVEEGYNLFYPNNQSSVFLIDNCGQLINIWEDSDNSRPGTVAYLTEEGNMIKAKTNGDLVNNSFGAGGAGGVLESVSWDNELLWQHVVADSITRQHHDIFIMDNDNILYVAWERKFFEEIVELGFDTLENGQNSLWFDCICEYNPALDSVVWKWCSHDHLIQNYDSTKLNFGAVEENPGLMDINYQEFSFGRSDFMHSNSVAYNPNLDQVLLSVRNFSEVWIIDHSISTEEAKGEKGNILHRWGNPKAYMQGDSSNKLLHYQHDAKWVLNENSPYFGQILVYNNMVPPNLSNGTIYNTPMDDQGVYVMENGRFLPSEQTRDISHPDTARQHSTAGSNIQLLPNGHFLMNAARQGRVLELTDREQPVWEYLIPLVAGEPAPQGFELSLSDNFNFKTTRYQTDYAGFEGKDLTPLGFLELDADEGFCTITNVESEVKPQIVVSPNPAHDFVVLSGIDRFDFTIYNSFGQIVLQDADVFQNTIDVSYLSSGIYFLEINDNIQKLIITD